MNDHNIETLELESIFTQECSFNFSPIPLNKAPIGKFLCQIMPYDTRIHTTRKKKQCVLWTLEIIGPESKWTQCTIQKYSDIEGAGIPYTMKDFLTLGIRLRSYFKISQKLTDTWNKMVWVDVIPNNEHYFVEFLRQPYQDEVEAVKADPNYIENSFIIR